MTLPRWLPLFALQAGLLAPSLGRPPHIDDPNFLRLAEGALRDPWRPHAIPINWQGTTERAFDVLSNPPGVAAWLAPLVGMKAPIALLHLWMWPWMALSAWGCVQLGRVVCPNNPGAAYALGLSPLVLQAGAALTPDAPLFALTVAGMAGVLSGRGPAFAALLGAAALFRYSAVALLPLPALWRLLQRDGRGALTHGVAAAAPLGLLLLHDAHAYGALHIQAMTQFQAVAETPRDLLRKLLAAVAMLGGVGLLPLVGDRTRSHLVGSLGIGLALGGLAVFVSDQSGGAALGTVLAMGAGGVVLGAAFAGLQTRGLGLLLGLWALAGLLFFTQLRFMAGRYWLVFLPAPVLLALRSTSRRWTVVAVCAQVGVGAALLADEDAFARAQARGALAAQELDWGRFAGHWGWQQGLEGAGWRPIEEDLPLPAGALWISSARAWPQSPGNVCQREVGRVSLAAPGWGLRGQAGDGAANVHAFVISDPDGVIESYAPWTLSDEPYDTLIGWVACGP